MKIKEITEKSKQRAIEIAEKDGGFLVSVYAVIKADAEGRVMSITHDHLSDLSCIEKEVK